MGQSLAKLSLFITDTISWFISLNGSKNGLSSLCEVEEVNEPLVTIQKYSNVIAIHREEEHHVPSATEQLTQSCQEIESKTVQDAQRFQGHLKNGLSSLCEVEEVNEPLVTIQKYSHVIAIHGEEEHHVPSATEQLTQSCQEIDIPVVKDIMEKKTSGITIPNAGNENRRDKQHDTNGAQKKVKEEMKREGIWMRDYCSSHKILLVGEGDFSFSVCLAKAFGSATNGAQKKVKEEVKRGIWVRDYCSSHKILLVGEGDFSFSVCLAKAFGSATNMVATSLDSLAFLEENYPSAKTHIGYLKKRGCTVIHEMDATQMTKNITVNDLIYDRIVFNFPLAGFFSESKKIQLKRNRNLVRLFFGNAKSLIADDGEVHIRHKSSSSYREWDLENLAKQTGFKLIKDEEFKLHHYRGYNNKYGFGGNENFNCYPSRTYKFALRSRKNKEF